ncbi:MAG: efflux RND transporter periplasmic adaptor subunit [Sphingomonadales bacterium]
MKYYSFRWLLMVCFSFGIVACGGNKTDVGNAKQLRAEIEKVKKEKASLDAMLRDLEARLAKADPASSQTALLVSLDTIHAASFTHYIDLQGHVDAEGMAYVAPSGMGGVVKSVLIKIGQRVSKGQTLLVLDDAMARQSLTAAQQQLNILSARLAQATTIYERYQNLWKQNIGAEISVINAKADVDALSAQLRAAQAQVGMAQEQVNMTRVKAEISGVVDELGVKVGEMFTPQAAATPGMGIRIVNSSQLKVVTAVPENYVTLVKQGSRAEIQVMESGQPSFITTLSVVGVAINANTRSFNAEASLPSNSLYKPNQNAKVRIIDYQNANALTVPLNTVQQDETGSYVYLASSKANRLLAKKQPVITGAAYGGMIEIRSGLTEGDLLITRGFQDAYQGQPVKPVQ